MISTKDFWKGRDVTFANEVTEEIKANAIETIDRVNAFLMYLGFGAPYRNKVSSGFRPKAINAATKGAAKKSSHMVGKAVDIADETGQLQEVIMKELARDPDLLKRFKLNMEHFKHTPTWVHLDTRDSLGYRIFTV